MNNECEFEVNVYDLHTIKTKSSRFCDVNSSDLSEVWCSKEKENAILKRTERELW